MRSKRDLYGFVIYLLISAIVSLSVAPSLFRVQAAQKVVKASPERFVEPIIVGYSNEDKSEVIWTIENKNSYKIKLDYSIGGMQQKAVEVEAKKEELVKSTFGKFKGCSITPSGVIHWLKDSTPIAPLDLRRLEKPPQTKSTKRIAQNLKPGTARELEIKKIPSCVPDLEIEKVGSSSEDVQQIEEQKARQIAPDKRLVT